MVEEMRSHPGRTAREVAESMGLTPCAVRHARARYGRGAAIDGLCIACDERPVWAECAPARAMRLCKGCYLRERALRLEESKEAARIRQAEFRERGRKR